LPHRRPIDLDITINYQQKGKAKEIGETQWIGLENLNFQMSMSVVCAATPANETHKTSLYLPISLPYEKGGR
jgi:hypothetical protein